MRRIFPTATLALALGCAEQAPPGADRSTGAAVVVAAPASARVAPPPGSTDRAGPEPGSIDDNLPFAPTKDVIASIAWRTWVYTDTGPQRTRYGYLRVGAVVPRRGPPIENDGCAGGGGASILGASCAWARGRPWTPSTRW